ncbi:flagellin [Heliophilum fasciatum]|uniref:Flagellin n=1 Tax=Heliophilum fasciatum TaxID=35700 RepID=A0A4R2RCE1_9FIRM|nr:flagellin [Heliophilum fasciatum]MCW2279465.1 flagellin [Heliophilum fasciatum]TCP59789.1 flagellin [Heliophilum fasciatum]
MYISNLIASHGANQLLNIEKRKAIATERLSSGLRINHAGDDAAGLTISEKMRAQIRGLSQAGRNIQDGISLSQTAEGGLAEITNNLQRIRELAVQAANDTLTSDDRAMVQDEVTQLIQGNDQIANSTEFNQITLLNNASRHQQSAISGTALNDENILSSPPVGNNGNLLFRTNQGYPTTAADDNQTLIFGSGDSARSVKVGGTVYQLQSLTITPTIEESGTFKTVYKVPAQDVEITQKVRIVQDKYEIRYSVINNSTTAQDIGLMFHIDTMLGNDDAAPFIVNGSPVTTETKYVGADIPDSFTVYNQHTGSGANAEIQAQGIIKGSDILETPSAFGVGNFSSVANWDWVPGGAFSDSGYMVRWDPRTLNPGDSFEVNTFYGLSVPPVVTAPTTGTSLEELYQLQLQVGPNAGNQFTIELSDVRSQSLAIDNLKVDPAEEARRALEKLDTALQKVTTERSKFGVYQSSLERLFNISQSYLENLQAAESRIRDVDMAKQILEFSKTNILSQTTEAMMAQANQQPQQVLQLLQSIKS